MRICKLLILLLLLNGCADDLRTLTAETHSTCTLNSGSRLTYEISNEIFKQLKSKGLRPCECGASGHPLIWEIHFGLDLYRVVDLEEARELLVTIERQFLEAFNSDERIRPYLATYPLTPKDIRPTIFLHHPDGAFCSPEELHIITIFQGNLCYRNTDPVTGHLKEFFEETFEEGEARLNARLQQAVQNPSIQLQPDQLQRGESCL